MRQLSALAIDEGLWEHVFTIAPLVLIGTVEPDGAHDLAPKHRVLPISCGTTAYFGFVCSPEHATQRNAVRTGAFTASWPHPGQIVKTSAAAAPRCADGEKRTMRGLPTLPATAVAGVLLRDASFAIECAVDRVVRDLGDCELIIGRVVAAHADPEALRDRTRADENVVHSRPLLAYLHPGRFATIDHSTGFPFPKGFEK